MYEKDEKKACVLSLLWLIGLAVGCYVDGATGLLIVALVTALCGLYIALDDARENNQKTRDKINKSFKAWLKTWEE